MTVLPPEGYLVASVPFRFPSSILMKNLLMGAQCELTRGPLTGDQEQSDLLQTRDRGTGSLLTSDGKREDSSQPEVIFVSSTDH